MQKIKLTGERGNWHVVIGEGAESSSYRDLTPGRTEEEALKRAQAILKRRKSSKSAYTSNAFLFGENGASRARASNPGGLFGDDVADAERALEVGGYDV